MWQDIAWKYSMIVFFLIFKLIICYYPAFCYLPLNDRRIIVLLKLLIQRRGKEERTKETKKKFINKEQRKLKTLAMQSETLLEFRSRHSYTASFFYLFVVLYG
jgi:hypothetical protein